MPGWKQVGRQSPRCGTGAVLASAAVVGAGLLAGCASPGPPRAPSLQLPAVVSDLLATRRGNDVELQFAVPARTSDGVPYRGTAVRMRVCRAVEAGSCMPVPALSGVELAVGTGAGTGTAGGPGRGQAGVGAGAAQRATLHDALPPGLTSGPVRLLTYRVELSNAAGRTAGFGDAAYAGAGAAPAEVSGLRAKGARGGVVVRWQPEAAAGAGQGGGSEVVLRRELVSGTGAGNEAAGRAHAPGQAGAAGASRRTGRGVQGKSAEAGMVWLSTTPLPDPLQSDGAHAAPARSANGVLDDGAAVDSTYRYAAERQLTAQLGGPAGGHTVVLHSALSAPVEVTLRAVYPPPAPTDLVGTVFPLAPVDDPASGGQAGGGLAVDLIWTPADDPKTVGYNVYRETVGAAGGGPGSARAALTATPVRMPAFHDVLPAALLNPAGPMHLRYSVTAVDASGMESPAATVVVEAGAR